MFAVQHISWQALGGSDCQQAKASPSYSVRPMDSSSVEAVALLSNYTRTPLQ
jgi:hypothetical protein